VAQCPFTRPSSMGKPGDDVRPGSVTATSTSLSEAWKGASKEPNLLITEIYIINNPPTALRCHVSRECSSRSTRGRRRGSSIRSLCSSRTGRTPAARADGAGTHRLRATWRSAWARQKRSPSPFCCCSCLLFCLLCLLWKLACLAHGSAGDHAGARERRQPPGVVSSTEVLRFSHSGCLAHGSWRLGQGRARGPPTLCLAREGPGANRFSLPSRSSRLAGFQ
jgi:hypothetical protein